jgi:hypothetical protein
MSEIKNLEKHLKAIEKISKSLGIKDIFRNKKFIEVLAAQKLGHRVNPSPGGADAWEYIDDVEYPTEYKSCDCSTGKGSFQFHWLSNNVMDSYRETLNIYFIGRNGIDIEWIYSIQIDKILPLIEEKATGGKSTNGHKAFSIKQLINLGAELRYEN